MREFVYVGDDHQLGRTVEAIRGESLIAFDTEFVGEATYEPQLCLLQVATGAGVWIVDPLSDIDLSDFWAALTEAGREVVAVAARQEILFCLRYAKRPPAKLFDPQLAAGLLGLGYPLSHTNLVFKVLNVRLEAGETFTDWRRRPLSPAQLDYAASDVRHLLAIRERLVSLAAKMKREDWIGGECAALVARAIQREAEDGWTRLGGIVRLKPREQAAVRALWYWRDGVARAANLPPRRILGDELLLQIAKRMPRNVSNLFALRGFDRPALRREGEQIVAAVRAALELPDGQLPSLQRRDDAPQLQILGQLCSVVANNLAARHQVDPALLATTADLQELVRWHLAAGTGVRPMILDGWRGDILGKPLLDLLEGKSVVRVADARLASPLRVD
jgi:ribonuclease D